MASDAALLLFLLAVAAALAGRSEGSWCVRRPELPDAALQKTLDYACGGGADCKPILQNGACFSPDTVKAHCSYAVNSFYQRSGQNPQACAFSGTAELSNSDPGPAGSTVCVYPSTQSAAQSPPGVDGPPSIAQGPSSFNDTSGAGILPVAGTVTPMVVLACCLLVALCFRL